MRAFFLAAVTLLTAGLTLASAAPPTYAAAGDPASAGPMNGRGHHHRHRHGGPRVFYYAPSYGYGYYSPYSYAPVPYDWTRGYGVTPSYAPAWSSGYVSPSYAPNDWSQGFVSPSVPLGVVRLDDDPPPAEVAPAPVCTPRLDVPTGILVDCP
ncbi:hypothetical protein [Caulobacter sp. 17J65-9]|uniref:hypothetical protein n=1 Tax=Caulobacter sp. 17J65-9 TaxID=2709382 RepID=UPI0013C7662C|nr:hypothetical protein [Caulobacter sp. 17J65-9]NEX93837.1 hypothetical protein [Caulobacter sp. 17J65-9]